MDWLSSHREMKQTGHKPPAAEKIIFVVSPATWTPKRYLVSVASVIFLESAQGERTSAIARSHARKWHSIRVHDVILSCGYKKTAFRCVPVQGFLFGYWCMLIGHWGIFFFKIPVVEQPNIRQIKISNHICDYICLEYFKSVESIQ